MVSWRDMWRFFSGPTIEELETAIPIKAPPPELPTDRNVIASGARQLLDEPVLELAFERLETRLYETWKASGAGGVAVREEAFRLHWAIEELRAELRRMVDSARVPQGLSPEEREQ